MKLLILGGYTKIRNALFSLIFAATIMKVISKSKSRKYLEYDHMFTTLDHQKHNVNIKGALMQI